MAVLWLISQGADVNQQAQLSGDTPLHLAVKYDMRVVLQVLLDLVSVFRLLSVALVTLLCMFYFVIRCLEGKGGLFGVEGGERTD